MNLSLRTELQARLTCEVRYGEPLARHTTYRIGGPAAALVLPRTPEDVSTTLQYATESGTRWLVLGLGSNVLIADRGFDGIVVRIGKGMDSVTRGGPELSRWTVGAGLPTPLLARKTATAGHSGMQRLVGVPGTVGGGVFMNAGAHGQDFGQVVTAVDVVDPVGTMRALRARDIAWRYRGSGLDGSIVVSATVELEPGDPEATQRELAFYLKKRKAGTPFDEPCCGSVFQNPPPDAFGVEGRSAGQLIEAAGLKGFRSGGAQVSPMHANYIVNTGGAKADEVRAVMAAATAEVRKRFGVELEPEVKLIGFAQES